jgi:hypothetical protein
MLVGDEVRIVSKVDYIEQFDIKAVDLLRILLLSAGD